MDQFVKDLKAEGSHDSQGVFTIAVDKASWKLAAYRLATPESYPLHVVASAVAGGSGRLSITRQPSSVKYSFDGPQYRQEELQMLSLPVLGDNVPRRLRELAIAVSAGSALGPLEFRSAGPQGGWQLTVSGGDVTLTTLPEANRGQSLEVLAPLSDLAVEILKARCRFTPLDLSVDGATLRSPIDFGMSESDYYGYYLLPGDTDLVVRPHTIASRQFFHWTGETQSGAPTIHLALTGRYRARREGITLLSDGVGHRMEAEEVFGIPYICGAVCANHLQKDISQSGYVENRDYERLKELLRASALDFVERFCVEPNRMPTAVLTEFRHALLDYAPARTSIPIQQFLSLSARSLPLTDRETLVAAGRAAAEGNLQEYTQTRQAFRTQLSLVRRTGKGEYSAAALMDAEALMHEAAGTQDPELAQLRAVWNAVYAAGNSRPEWLEDPDGSSELASQRWAEACLQSEAPAASRYRARLIMIAHSPRAEIENWLDTLEVAPEWGALIRFAVLVHQKRLQELPSYNLGCLREPLQAMALALGPDLSEAQEAFLALAQRGPQGPRWLEVGGAMTMSRCRFGAWVAFRARLSMAASHDPGWKAWNAYRDWKGTLSAQKVARLSVPAMVANVFRRACLPLLCYRLVLIEGLEEALSFLSPVLLHHSLGPLSSPLTNLDQLPQDGLMWS